MNIETAVERYHALVSTANFAQVEQASVWYFEAQEVAEDVAEILSLPLENGAAIVSAFSPRERWASNVQKAYAFANGKPVTGLSNNLKMANDAKVNGFDALKGMKTNAFARAIAGDPNAVVIDVWMCRAANAATDSPSKGLYNILSDAIRIVADEFGISPRTCQALIWIVVRGSAA